MTCYLGIDHGGKRIGLAVADNVLRLPSPVKTVPGAGDATKDVGAILPVSDEYGADAFVLGLPLNMDGTEGPQATLVRQFGQALGERTGKVVYYVDERLSSFAADELIRPAELTHKKKKNVQDAVAAAVILRTFLSEGPLPDPRDAQE